ncbi:MAG TPA: ATP-binding protein [Cyclobacteriaceae bacterium]|nr:ATP-binding protein [Cyclobacteriaceae bacterium]
MQNYQQFKVDLSNCDKEPIHIIGRIQPHGFLLVIDSNSLLIEQISENLNSFVPDIAAKDWLGSSIMDLLPQGSDDWFKNVFLANGYDIVALGGKKFFGFNHFSGDKIIVECEPYSDPSPNEKLQQLDKLSQLKTKLNQLEDQMDMAKLVAKEMQEYLDYDRVNVIRFDKNWNSEVIGESLKGDSEAFMGHRFPASDIPSPARNLLLRKTVRQIPDVKAKAVDILPYVNPSTGAPTDILKSELRNPSEIHLEYLNNMEVRSTISFSILSKNRLWGLITCHNYQPVFIDAWKRKMALLTTQALASEITSIQKSADLKTLKQLTQQRVSIVEALEKHEDLATGLDKENLNLLFVQQGIGAAILLNRKLYCYGLTPSEAEIRGIIYWLVNENNSKTVCTRSLWKVFPEAINYKDKACGLLALEISKYNDEYLLFFKPEIPRVRIWAGNPEKPELKDSNYIHPRKSFEKWEEVVRGKSQKWTKNELDVARTFVKDLTAFQLRDQAASLKVLNFQLEKSAQKLEAKNNQLEDFSLIMAHNLRAPMNNILLLHEYYQSEPTEANSQFLLQKIPSIVENMINTMNDLNKVMDMRLGDELPSEEVDLGELMEKEWENLQTEEIRSAGPKLSFDLQVPYVYLPKVYAESILHNFISNALKYRSSDRQPHIEIKSWEEENQICLSIADNGLGMNLDSVGDKLFGLYKTFHFHKQAKGMGLYLTKMQVEALGGDISVQSELGNGSTFTVCLPKSRMLARDIV